MSDKAYSSAIISLPQDPLDDLDAVTKQFLMAGLDTKVNLDGDTMTGPLYLPLIVPIISDNQVPTKKYVDDAIGAAVIDAVDVVFSPSGEITATNVQDAIEDLESLKVSKSGDIMTGYLTLVGPPTTNSHAATKVYADLQGTKEVSVNISIAPYEIEIVHDLGRKPNVIVEDNSGNTGFTTWEYDLTYPNNKLKVFFSSGFVGKVILT